MAHKKIIDSVKKQGQVAIKDLDEFLRFIINESDMRTYSDYLAGNCWQYCITDEDGNVVDSCSGFIGDDLEKNGILNYICDYIEK